MELSAIMFTFVAHIASDIVFTMFYHIMGSRVVHSSMIFLKKWMLATGDKQNTSGGRLFMMLATGHKQNTSGGRFFMICLPVNVKKIDPK